MWEIRCLLRLQQSVGPAPWGDSGQPVGPAFTLVGLGAFKVLVIKLINCYYAGLQAAPHLVTPPNYLLASS